MKRSQQYLFQHTRLETARDNVQASIDGEDDPYLAGKLDHIMSELNQVIAIILMKYNDCNTRHNNYIETTRC